MIPFEKQQDNHSCGPAALAMVYRSLGKVVAQNEIWPEIRQKEGSGRWGSRTYLVCQDALRRGLAGLIIQARQPAWNLLDQCHRHRLRVIINHRLRPDKTSRHFSVLVAVNDDEIVIHDPLHGPEQHHGREAFLELWAPNARGHAAGHIVVALAEPGGRPIPPCPACGREVPAEIRCRVCGKGTQLEPAAALGCADPACPAAVWKRLFCTNCDTEIASGILPLEM